MSQRRSAPQPATAKAPTGANRKNFLIASADVNSWLQHLADSALIIILGVGCGSVYGSIINGTVYPAHIQIGVSVAAALAFATLVRTVTSEQSAVVTNSYERLRDAALAWTLAFGILSFGLFMAKAGSDASRGTLLTFYFVGLPLLAVWRVLTPVRFAPYAKRVGSAVRECIVIGDNADPLVEKFAGELRASGHPDPTIFKFRASCHPRLWQSELDVLSDRVVQAAHHCGPGEIYICAGSIPRERLTALGRRLTMLPRAIYVIPDTQIATLVRCRPVKVGTHVVLEARREPLGPSQRAVKRLIDITASATLLAILSPLLLLVAAVIKIDSRGPVLFRQTRNGYCGRPFRIFKFRSMHVQENGPVIKQAIQGDARVTRVGRYLRKFSVDELPQLANILLGDMSLVGPRPHAQAHDELYARSIQNYEIRQHVKPGLTGWAQVNGLRGETATIDAMHRRIEYDLWYAVNASVLLDIEILARTAIEVVRPRNAY